MELVTRFNGYFLLLVSSVQLVTGHEPQARLFCLFCKKRTLVLMAAHGYRNIKFATSELKINWATPIFEKWSLEKYNLFIFRHSYTSGQTR